MRDVGVLLVGPELHWLRQQCDLLCAPSSCRSSVANAPMSPKNSLHCRCCCPFNPSMMFVRFTCGILAICPAKAAIQHPSTATSRRDSCMCCHDAEHVRSHVLRRAFYRQGVRRPVLLVVQLMRRLRQQRSLLCAPFAATLCRQLLGAHHPYITSAPCPDHRPCGANPSS